MNCEVCTKPLSPRGRQVTGLCYDCLRDGARFAHAWMGDLAAGGAHPTAIGEVTGVSASTVRARLSELRRGIA